MAVRWSICTAVLLLSAVSTIAKEAKRVLPVFHRGRFYNGFVPEPASARTIRSANAVLEEYFDQQLDHFKTTDTRLWKQRFFTNAEFSENDGPVFLFVSGESTATIEWMYEGEWLVNAKEHHALCFQLEQRFFGKSQPLPDLSTENLAYLTSEQALADIAFFIQAMNLRYNCANRKWILWGGSYGGTLAAMMRVKYPHLALASVNSSGGLVATLDFYEYLVVVRDVLGQYSKSCLDAVSDGTQQIGRLLQENSGRSQLNEIFRFCEPIDTNNKKDVANLYGTFANNIAGVVVNNNVHLKSNPNNIEVADLCNIMENESIGTPVQRLAALNSLFLDSTGTPCLAYTYNDSIEFLRNVSINSPATQSGARQWIWLSCTEFGSHPTSDKVHKIFGDFPIDFFVEQCIDIYGQKFTKKFQENAIQRTNTIYGGRGLQARRVVFVRGSADPWQGIGMLRTLHPDAPVVYIQGTAHCADLYSSSPNDPIQLIWGRDMVRRYIRQWLRESNCDTDSPIEAVASPWWGFGWAQPFLNGIWKPLRFV